MSDLAASQKTVSSNQAVAAYWNDHIHDHAMARNPVGTAAFFQELDEYRFDKLRYLPQQVNFNGYAGLNVLEVGCGVGTDLARFARGGALVTGIDLASVAIDLAETNFQQRGLPGAFYQMDGADMRFDDNSFNLVYAHGVLQYAVDPAGIIREIVRVLRPGGSAILMVHNRNSWLKLLATLTHVRLEHEDAPVYRLYSEAEFAELLAPFSSFRIVPDRFPVATRLHSGWKALLYNELLVKGYDLLPRSLVQRFGWHLLAFASKAA